ESRRKPDQSARSGASNCQVWSSSQSDKQIRFARPPAVDEAERAIKLLRAPDRGMVLVGQLRQVLVYAHLRLVARHGFPHGRPRLTRVDDGCERPVRPWRDRPFEIINLDAQA